MSVSIEEIFLRYFLKLPRHFNGLVSVTIKGDSFDVSLNIENGGVKMVTKFN